MYSLCTGNRCSSLTLHETTLAWLKVQGEPPSLVTLSCELSFDCCLSHEVVVRFPVVCHCVGIGKVWIWEDLGFRDQECLTHTHRQDGCLVVLMD